MQAYYWQRYGKNQLDLLAPLEALPTYVKRTYHWAFDAWRDRLWQEFTLDGVTVGAPQFIVTVWQSRSAPAAMIYGSMCPFGIRRGFAPCALPWESFVTPAVPGIRT